MNTIFSLLKTQLSRILVVFLASTLLLFSTACSRADATDVRNPNLQKGGNPNTPGQVQPYQGGMNNFSDTDPNRVDTKSAGAKAKALRDRVQSNINNKGIDSVDQYVENYRTGTPLNERVGNIGNDVKRGTEDVKENLKDFSKQGPKNVERNAKDAPDAFGRTVDKAKENAKGAARDISGGAKDTADKAGKVVNRAGDFAQDRANDAGNAARRAID